MRTTARSRPPIYFFGDSLGLLGFGGGRQRETIEASLVFEDDDKEEEEEGEGEGRGIFEEGEEGGRFEKAKYPIENLKPKVFDEELNRSTEQIPSETGKEMKEGCTTSPQVPSSPISSTSPPTSMQQGPAPPPTTTTEPPPTTTEPPPTTTAPPPTTTAPPPSSKIDNSPLTTIMVDSRKNLSSPAEGGGSLTREEIIKLFTSRNPPDQKSS